MPSRTKIYTELLAEMQASNRSSARLVDLAISMRVGTVDTSGAWLPERDVVLLDVGGRWDRRRKIYGVPETHMVLRVHHGQEEAARWLAEWFRRKRENDWNGAPRPRSLQLVGGRRSGKSHLGVLALVLYAVAFAGAVVVGISPTLEATGELDRALIAMMPRAWYVRRDVATGRALVFKLANGSRIELRSAHRPSSMKTQGRIDFGLLNESQLVDHRAYVNLRGGLADRGGLLVLTCNPPSEPIGRWVEDLFRGIGEGTVPGFAAELDPRRNPFVDYAALESLAAETDERTYQREVLGLFTPIGDVVMYAWSQLENLREPPANFVDVTARVTRRELGREAAYVLGVDLQRSPAIVGAVLVVLEDPARPGVEFPWVVDEVWTEPGDENDFLTQIEAMPRWQASGRVEGDCYVATSTAVIMDASSAWQTADHKGGTSDRAFTARGWRWIFKPQKDNNRNPDILERMKRTNAMLKSAAGVRRFYVAPWAKRIATALRLYENKHGKPNRSSPHAHAVDAASYPIFRLYGEIKIERPATPTYEGIGRFDVVDAGW